MQVEIRHGPSQIFAEGKLEAGFKRELPVEACRHLQAAVIQLVDPGPFKG